MKALAFLSNPLRFGTEYRLLCPVSKFGPLQSHSVGINLSEDIYAGFNHLLRGGTIPYIEYVQVDKGRDVGMQQIYKFEAKLASGNAEQCLSRTPSHLPNPTVATSFGVALPPLTMVDARASSDRRRPQDWATP